MYNKQLTMHLSTITLNACVAFCRKHGWKENLWLNLQDARYILETQALKP